MLSSAEANFYRNLKPFNDFSELLNSEKFVDVPDSWCVVLTDVRGSTKAIKEGRYKQVNLVGAASVTCVLNALDTYEIPFVFGGDGATLLVHKDDLEIVKAELRGLKALSQREFDLELRVGIVSIKTLKQLGAEIRVGKYELSPGNFTAQFKGSGLTLAEDMIKKQKPEGAFFVEISERELPPKLTGLSCRLDPLETKKGVILSVLVKPKPEYLSYLMKELRKILNDDFKSANPANLKKLNWRWPPVNIRNEVAIHMGVKNRLSQWLSTLWLTLITKVTLSYNISFGSFSPVKYKSELISNTDFKKFDETLRMVIDCTLDQAKSIEDLLIKIRDEGHAVFGLHKSRHAIMTCMVRSASDNKHIHFVDGGDGGYALAALQLKATKN